MSIINPRTVIIGALALSGCESIQNMPGAPVFQSFHTTPNVTAAKTVICGRGGAVGQYEVSVKGTTYLVDTITTPDHTTIVRYQSADGHKIIDKVTRFPDQGSHRNFGVESQTIDNTPNPKFNPGESRTYNSVFVADAADQGAKAACGGQYGDATPSQPTKKAADFTSGTLRITLG